MWYQIWIFKVDYFKCVWMLWLRVCGRSCPLQCILGSTQTKEQKECWTAARVLAVQARAGWKQHSCIKLFHALYNTIMLLSPWRQCNRRNISASTLWLLIFENLNYISVALKLQSVVFQCCQAEIFFNAKTNAFSNARVESIHIQSCSYFLSTLSFILLLLNALLGDVTSP